MTITIGKRNVEIKEVNDKAIEEAIEKETMLEVIYSHWIDNNTLYYTCGGESVYGYKLISGMVKTGK